MSTDATFMQYALDEAVKARDRGEVPVGCVAVLGDAVIGRGHNLRETLQDPTAHAEMVALREAATAIGSWRLENVVVYVTLEPCPMCAGALVNSRVSRVVYGCDDPKAGAARTLFSIGTDTRLNHRFDLSAGIRADECATLLSEFFAGIRSARRSRVKPE